MTFHFSDSGYEISSHVEIPLMGLKTVTVALETSLRFDLIKAVVVE